MDTKKGSPRLFGWHISLLLLLLLFLVFFVGEGLGQEGRDCFPYVLENECSFVVNSSSLSPVEQETRFSLLSLPISDIRMVAAECRRPFLYLLCSFSFGYGCDFGDESSSFSSFSSSSSSSSSFSSSPNIILEEFLPACEEVSEYCSLNCTELVGQFAPFFMGTPPISRSLSSPSLSSSSFSSSSPSSSSSTSSSSSFLPSYIPPIPVTTCLFDYTVKTTCCFNPYDRHSNEECGIGCPLPVFSETADFALLIVCYIGVFSAIPLFIFCFVPLWLTPEFHTFPRYALPMSIIFFQVTIMTQTWSLFDYPENYLCDGHEDYISAFENLSSSPICYVQLGLTFFFGLYSEWWLGVVFFFTVALISQTPPPIMAALMTKRGERTIHTLGIIYSVTFSLIPTLGGYYDDSASAFPPNYACTIGTDDDWGLVFWIPFSILFGAIAFTFFLTMLWFFCKNAKIFFILHWRILAFSVWSIFCYGIVILTVWWVNPANGDETTERYGNYLRCVARHPRDEDAGCELEALIGEFFLGAFYVMSWWCAPISCFLAYCSPSVFGWWKLLVTERKIPLRQSRQESYSASETKL